MSELAAGAELDAEIAQRVFGLRVEWDDEECSSATPGAKWVYGSEYWAVSVPYVYHSEDDDEGEYLQSYSSDIAAAWLVVEAMRARGYSFEVGCNPDRKKTGYESTFWEPYEKGKMVRMWEAEADTAPVAICRAALKALENANV